MKVASTMSRSSRWAGRELPSSGGLDPYTASEALTRTTPSTAMSPTSPTSSTDTQSEPYSTTLAAYGATTRMQCGPLEGW